MNLTEPVTIEVEMHAFGDGKIRIVTLPDGIPADQYLGATFQYGQNDFQPQPMPSVSVGDIIRLPDGTRHAVLGCGFAQVAADFMPPAGDRGSAWTYLLQDDGR